jgi:hypothetical protein
VLLVLICFAIAVPCLRRAAEVESSNAEFALGGDEEGWVATHRSPGEKGTGGQQGGGAAGAKPRESDDGIPSIDEAGTSKQPTAGGTEGTSTAATAATGSSNVAGASAAAQQQADDDIPDISDLALGVAADDEVSSRDATTGGVSETRVSVERHVVHSFNTRLLRV